MCATCGCGQDEVHVTALTHEHGAAEHGAAEQGAAGHTHTVSIEAGVLAKNDALATRNRTWLADRGAVAVNLMSSPGAGKTTLLERTLGVLSESTPVCVVEGDQDTLLDADRIRATGCPVVQVNTGAGCHLDADMLWRSLQALDPPATALVFVENVGNLVCPALFDLGESNRVVVMSVPEGVDKPLKYPHMFASADLVLVNKIDLLPYVDVDLDELRGKIRRVNPRADVLPVSATRGDGLDAWYSWLRATRVRVHRGDRTRSRGDAQRSP